MAIKFVDVIVDLQYGDTGKGKVAHALAASGEYNLVLRYNGGANAGHTVYHNGQKVVTHQVPIGVLFGIKSVIGPGCVVNIGALAREIQDLMFLGIKTEGLIFVDKRAHVVTQQHLEEDGSDAKIGTTKQGIGPAYRDKYGRVGKRIGDDVLSDFGKEFTSSMFTVVDIYEMLYSNRESYQILCEGAQGFHLDVDWGEYPYVTSSHCTIGSAVLNGIPPKKIRKVIGTMKAYETYVGNRTDYTDETNPIFKRIQELGQEFGATTGRPRKVNWMSLDRVIMATNVNGVTDIIINKADVLQEAGQFSTIFDGVRCTFKEYDNFKNFVDSIIHEQCGYKIKITWSLTPNGI
jgi:adenylosuccinate synthase